MEESHKDVTIYDIAERLNLATSTISRALKDHHSIGHKTTMKVKEVAEEMGYRPNALAAGLRNNNTMVIGVLISNINSPFLSSLISGIEETAQKAGYRVMITQSHDSYTNEVNLAKALYSSKVCGLICSLAMETRDVSHFQNFLDKNIPLVFVDRVPREFDTYRIMIDNYSAGYKATKHLIDQGCKRIAHLTGLQHINTYSERKRGYIDALIEADLPVDEMLIIDYNALTFEEGEKASNYLYDLENPPDGIFCGNDSTAVKAIQCAKKRGLKIPQEIAIIGFNDDPELSSITHPSVEMGRASAKKIISYLKTSEKDDISEITFLNTEVVVRESSNRQNANFNSSYEY